MKKHVLIFLALLCTSGAMALEVVNEGGGVVGSNGDVNCPFNVNVGTGRVQCSGTSIRWTDSSGQTVSWDCTLTPPPAAGWNYTYHCACPTDWQLPLNGAQVISNCWMPPPPGGSLKWIKIEMQTVNIHNS